MATIKNVNVGDLLQTADASEMWLVIDAHHAATLPEWKGTQRFRLCKTKRANNDKWRWAWVRLKALNLPDQKDLVLYWDPREGEVGDLPLRSSSYYAADRLFHPEEAKAAQDRLASQRGRRDFVEGLLEKFKEQVEWDTSPSSPACYELTSWLHRDPDFQSSNVKMDLRACSWEKTSDFTKKDVKPYQFCWHLSGDAVKVRCSLYLDNAETVGWSTDTLDWKWEIHFTFPQK